MFLALPYVHPSTYLEMLVIIKYEKHFPKMLRDVGMAVPKTTETRCRDGSVQARQDIKRLHKQPHPYIFLFP